MSLYSVSPELLTNVFAHWPESLPGVRYAQFLGKEWRGNPIRRAVLILGDVVVVVLDGEVENDVQRLTGAPWAVGGSFENRSSSFDQWLEDLNDFREGQLEPLTERQFVALVVGPIDPKNSPKSPDEGVDLSKLHGHLPYNGKTDEKSVVYRFEPFPRSIRINQEKKYVYVRGGMYCAPPSELPFLPTGFSVVGRYALPNFAPAIYRWELRPPPGRTFRCGASVPLNGQAGGGVELHFDNDFHNVGPIANPVILPVL